MQKKLFVITIFLIFLLSFAYSAEIIPPQASDQFTNQQFAQLNAKILEISNQISSLKAQNDSFQQNAFMKSDTQNLYENMVNIGKQSNLDVLTSVIVVVILAFCVFFILIGKNLLPVHTKEWRETKEKENKALLTENLGLKKRLEKLQVNTSKKPFLAGWRKPESPKLNAPTTTPEVNECKDGVCMHNIPSAKDYPTNPSTQILTKEQLEEIKKTIKEEMQNEAMVKPQN